MLYSSKCFDMSPCFGLQPYFLYKKLDRQYGSVDNMRGMGIFYSTSPQAGDSTFLRALCLITS